MIEHETMLEESNQDIFVLLSNIKKGILRFWWLVILLAVLTSGIICLEMKQSYKPEYTAAAIFSVKLNLSSDGTIYEDNLRASQLSATFPYIITSGVLRSIIASDLGVESVNDSISAENVEGTNLFKIKVTAEDAGWAYQVLLSVIKNYPKVAETVVGSTYLDIIEETGIPGKPSNSLNYIKIMIFGALPGMAAGILIVLIYALTRKTIHNKEDFEELSNIRLLGTLPKVVYKKRGKNKERCVSIKNERLSAYRDNIYRIRNRVEKTSATRDIKSILITSALPGEGKSTVAFNLALALAQEGRRIVLVDCDLHRPSINRMLELSEQNNGLKNYLEDGKELEEAIQYMDGLNLSVLACAEAVESSSEIINSDKIHHMVARLKESYDYVILDTAPTAILSDTTDLARYVDGAIYIVKQDYANINHILDGLEHLSESSSINILGFVFNNVKARLGSYSYGYGYGKYGHYGYGRKKHGNEPVMEE